MTGPVSRSHYFEHLQSPAASYQLPHEMTAKLLKGTEASAREGCRVSALDEAVLLRRHRTINIQQCPNAPNAPAEQDYSRNGQQQ